MNCQGTFPNGNHALMANSVTEHGNNVYFKSPDYLWLMNRTRRVGMVCPLRTKCIGERCTPVDSKPEPSTRLFTLSLILSLNFIIIN